MREATGDLWDWYGKAWVVVPVNIGWTKKDPQDEYAKVGPNPMGTGVAAEVPKRFRFLPHVYGHYCFMHRMDTEVAWTCEGLILFPTKPLNEENPHLSWRSKASPALIVRGLKELAALELPTPKYLAQFPRTHAPASQEVMVPLLGCGSGGLREEEVVPVMREHLDDRFVLVRQGHPF